MVDNYIVYLDRTHIFQHFLATSGVYTTSRDETIETNLAKALQSQMKNFKGWFREKSTSLQPFGMKGQSSADENC